MDPLHILLILTVLILLITAADLAVDLRHGLPHKRRAEQREDARRAVAAAEALHPGPGRGTEKRLTATQHLLDMHPGMSPGRALLLVQASHAEAQKP